MQWSQLCATFIFPLQTLGHHLLFVKLLRCGLAIRVFTSNTTLPKIWNLRNLFRAWRRDVKYQRLALKEVNITFVTYFSEEKKQKKIWKIELVDTFFIYFTIGTQICPKTDNHIRNVSGFQGVQGLLVVKLIWWQHRQQTEQIMSQVI